jgi:radical SAM protein (TIGR01212 family)
LAEAVSDYPSIGDHWRRRFGERVQRVSLDAGLSCPNRDGTLGTAGCTFCDPVSFSPAAGDRRPAVEQLTDGMRRVGVRSGARRFAAYFQPHTNTYAPEEELRNLWEAVCAFPEVVALCVGTRPDCVSDGILDLLASYRYRFEIWLELGLQSSHDETLARLGRGHSAAAFADACSRSQARGLSVCAHAILGLPGEGPEEESATARFLGGLGVEGVKLHQLAVVSGTALEVEWHRGALELLAEEEYIDRAAAFLRLLPKVTVLHRLVGDTASNRLLAPHYNKGRVVAALRRKLQEAA